MDLQSLKDAIDYYQSFTPSLSWQQAGIVLSMVAGLAAAITAVISYRAMKHTVAAMQAQIDSHLQVSATQSREANERYLADRWDQVFKECIQHPVFLDATKTDSFHHSMQPEEQLRYAAFCYRLWDLVNEMTRRTPDRGQGSDADRSVRAQALLNWSWELHGTWLSRNPEFFPDNRLWDAIEATRSRTHMIMRYKPLPQKNGDIDWEAIAPRYYESILSPFAPDMLKIPPGGKARNPLVKALRDKADEMVKLHAKGRRSTPHLRILELGCGPGTLVDALTAAGVTDVDALVFVDREPGLLSAAGQKAKSQLRIHGGLSTVRSDMLEVKASTLAGACAQKFDLVIAANAILFPRREDVVRAFEVCRDQLDSSGEVLLILPSFDTTEYLERLWFASALRVNDQAHALRVARAFRENKLLDREQLLFADDGHQQQGYHSPESIAAELGQANLHAIDRQRIYYSWKLCKPFDYGYFPNARELLEASGELQAPRHWDRSPQPEIWDWFIRAR